MISVNCPSCGLLNLSTASVCSCCKTALVPLVAAGEPADQAADLSSNKSVEMTTQTVISPQLSSPEPQPSDWREQLNSKLDRIQEKNSESQPATTELLLNDIRNREFSRSVKEGPSSNQQDLFQSRPEYHPLAERILEKLKRSELSRPVVIEPQMKNSAEQIFESQPRQSLPKSHIRKVKRRSSARAEKIERIEISLSQGTLPFDDPGNSSHQPWDYIHKGLTAAPIATRMRAGAIDGLFICGCLLIFLMIIFFIPDFAFFSKSAFLGLATAGILIANAYLFLLTAFSARTLGMDHEHLQVLNFKGELPSLEETSLRSFGYFISLGCFCLGFLWAFFDSEKLTWHDRISKTLIIHRDLFNPGEGNS
jgi:uncharacterized RDD family membrane protein YckC